MRYKHWVAVFFSLTLFMDFLDGAIVNVAMPTFAAVFHASPTEIQWISTIYLLAIAMFVLVSGWAGDRFGSKKLFLGSLGLFTIGSLACAVSATLPGLVAARALQGVGGGMLAPVGSSLVMRAFTPEERVRWSGVMMVPGMMAPVLAPSLGGYLVQYHSWHWIFGINVPVGVLTLVAALWVLREERHSEPTPLDVEGFALSGLSLAALFYGLNAAADPHVPMSVSAASLALGIPAGAAFLWCCAHKRQPLVDLSHFRDPTFRRGTLLQYLLIGGLNGSLFAFTLCEQDALRLSPLHTGMLTLMQAAGSTIMMPLAGKYSAKWGHDRTVLTGILVYTASTAVLCMDPVLQTSSLLIPALAVRGAGLGMCLVLTWSDAFRHVSQAQMGRATATMSAVIQLGGACGVAAAAAILAMFPHHLTQVHVYRAVLGGFAVLGLVAWLCAVPASTVRAWLRPASQT